MTNGSGRQRQLHSSACISRRCAGGRVMGRSHPRSSATEAASASDATIWTDSWKHDGQKAQLHSSVATTGESQDDRPRPSGRCRFGSRQRAFQPPSSCTLPSCTRDQRPLRRHWGFTTVRTVRRKTRPVLLVDLIDGRGGRCEIFVVVGQNRPRCQSRAVYSSGL